MKNKKTPNNKSKNNNIKVWEYLSKIEIKHITLVIIIYNIVGVLTNYIKPFPLYGFFATIFSFIAAISVLAIRYFLCQMKLILIEVSGEPRFRNAKYEFEKMQNKKIILVIPLFVIMIYAGTGIPMIKSFELNCSMIFALIAFIPTVYLSILVYIQYIFLAVFIYKVNNCNDKYLSYIEQCPANSTILYLLSELVYFFRNSFFAIGTAYIIAFGLFTLSNAFGIDISINNYFLVIGWGIITVAIVFVFPIISFLEKKWLLSIIRSLKVRSTKNIQKNYTEHNSDKLQASNLIISIWQTPDYPIKESVSLGYGILTTILNLVTMLYYARELFVS